MFTNVSTYPCLPKTERGEPLVLGGDPKGKTFLYPHGNSIIIRDINNPSICDIYTEHSVPTTVAKYSPSGFYIASADSHGKIRIWDTTQKEHILKNEFQPFVGEVKDLAWSADSQRIVAVGKGRERFGHVFSMDTGTSIGEISGHSKIINSCDFKSSRPFKIITGSEDMFIGIHEGPPFKFKSQIQDHERFVQSVRFSPNGDMFASGGFDGKLFVYNSNDYSKLCELGCPAHKGGIYAISWSPDNKQILSSSGDKTCKIWDVASASLVTDFNMGSELLDQQVSCLWQEPHLLSVSLSGFINYLDKNNPAKPLKVVKGHSKSITAMALPQTDDQSDPIVFTSSHDGCINYWSTKTGNQDRVSGPQHTNQVQDMSATNTSIYTCGLDDTLRVIDFGSKALQPNFVKLPSQPKALVAFKDKPSKVIVGCVGKILLYEGQTLKSEVELNYDCSCADLHPDNKQLAIGGSDKIVHIYLISNDQISEINSLTQSRGAITDVKFSPDGNYLAASDNNRKVILYETKSFSLANDTEWGFHTAKVNCLAWSPNSERLASGSLDTNLIVWSPKEPIKHILVKHAHAQSQVTRVVFVDNNTIVTTGQDATVKTWKFSPK